MHVALKIRAVYEDGYLRLLTPVDLQQGQEVEVTVTLDVEPNDQREKLKSILGDMVRWSNPDDDSDAWVEDMADEIDKAFQGDPPLSHYIIDDRGEV